MTNIETLIEEGKRFTFKGNSSTVSHGTYTQASSELLDWIARVEDFIRNTYGEDSGAYKLYLTFNRKDLNGYEEREFNKQMNILLGAVSACKGCNKVKVKRRDEHLIIQLIKNPFFWTVLVVVCAGSFGLGLHFGASKFDNEKNQYYEQTKVQRDEINGLKKRLSAKEAAIVDLNRKLQSDKSEVR